MTPQKSFNSPAKGPQFHSPQASPRGTPRTSPTKRTSTTSINHRFSIFATLAICAAFTIINIYVGHRNLHHFRNRQRRQYEHNHDAPHINNNRRRQSRPNAHNKHKERKTAPTLTTNDRSKIYDGGFITQLLRGEKRPPQNIKRNRFKYQPGSLQMTSTESLQYCHVNMTQYGEHFPQKNIVLVSISESHKLIYRNIPKSASSSSRHAMQNLFDGQDLRMKVPDMKSHREEGYKVISFVRDPLERFYSSYDEAFFRKGPWFGEGRLVINRPGEVKGYLKNKYKLDPYPYLYEGLKTYNDYRDKFCDLGGDKKCKLAETIDDGDLTRRFEQFVHDYNGTHPFDVHLSLQVPFLTNPKTGKALPISMLYNASEAEADWASIAKHHGVEIPEDGLIHGRKSPRRFNMDLVTEETKRKICRIAILDYCCLNMELPEVCKSDVEDEDGAYSCAVERNGNNLHILPWNNL